MAWAQRSARSGSFHGVHAWHFIGASDCGGILVNFNSSSHTPRETGGASGGTTSGPSCKTPCDGACKRRGPVEALAKELWEVAAGHVSSPTDWDCESIHPDQRAATVAIARHVLRKFDGKVFH